ncbi:MAG TPA: acetate kinase [Jiangellaceae bacterium]|nr:acetate kinase [Jiangellaceae bacterium]
MTDATVLVLNCGSSSIKYQLVDAASGEVLARGLAERIGEDAGRLTHAGGRDELTRSDPIPNHESGLQTILDAFEETGPSLAETGLTAVGHRVVHGGERFADPVLIDDDVVAEIGRLVPLAPLHNPANLAGIEVARKVLPGVAHVAVFDTAFHQTMPPHAYTYAVPHQWHTEYGVRRYGFHGTSVAHVSREAARLLGRDVAEANLIVAHLGNGASITAVAGGRSVDTSMGLTPLEGLVMGTRSGDLDPAIVAHLWRVAGVSAEQTDDALNRSAGLLALAGANDMREVHRREKAGDDAARLALDVYCYRLRKYVGAYFAALGRVDAVVFTAGVGENDADVRARSLTGLERLGITVDPDRNAATADRGPRVISPDGSDVAVLVVPTNEELEIARQAHAVATRSP